MIADHYHPVVQEIALSDDGVSYTMLQNCTVDFEVQHLSSSLLLFLAPVLPAQLTSV